MSSIRLQGATSGYYDLTVPAAAGTNSIDLSTLVTTNSSGNLTLDGNLTVQGQFEVHKDYNANYYKKADGTTLGYILFRDNGPCYYEYNSTNSGQDFRFASNNQTKMTLDATGRMTVPNQPSFKAWRNTSAWSLGVDDVFLFDQTEHNIGNHYSTSTGRFTAPISGTYQFNYYTIYRDNAGNDWISLRKNGNRFYGGDLHFSTDPGSQWDTIGGSMAVYLNSGDWVALYAGTAHTYHGNNWSGFSGFLVG